jgi:hypothetical protein
VLRNHTCCIRNQAELTQCVVPVFTLICDSSVCSTTVVLYAQNKTSLRTGGMRRWKPLIRCSCCTLNMCFKHAIDASHFCDNNGASQSFLCALCELCLIPNTKCKVPIRVGVWPCKTLSADKFKRPQKFESQNIYLFFWLMETLKDKHETDVNESIILELLFTYDSEKLK